MLRYKVVIIYEDEAKQTIVMTDRQKAIECARANRWSTIYVIS